MAEYRSGTARCKLLLDIAKWDKAVFTPGDIIYQSTLLFSIATSCYIDYNGI
jgi:hypothetical protein